MEWRYVVAGVNVLLFSVILAAAGVVSGAYGLAGVAASSALVGVVLVGLGFLYSEPLHTLFRDYSAVVQGLVSRLVEDLGVLDRGVLGACPRDGGVVVFASSGGLDCDSVVPGVYAVGDTVYIAVEGGRLVAGVEGGSLEEVLRELLIGRYGVCRGVHVERVAGGFRVTLTGVGDAVTGVLGWPLNPVDAVLLAAVAVAVGRLVTVGERRLVGRDYIVVLKVGGG